VLGGDWTLQSPSIPPEDVQYLQTRTFTIGEVARWFNVPKFMIGDLSEGATFNNVEQLSQNFLQQTLLPIVEKYESELTSKLFGQDGEFFIRFKVEDYLRTDTASQMERYRTLTQGGMMTVNEVRKEMLMQPVEGGDDPLVQGAQVKLKDAGAFANPSGNINDETGE